MRDLSWRDAIIKVLSDSAEPMHYSDIADEAVAQELRKSFGVTPHTSVAVTISKSLETEGDRSPFIRVSRGVYALRDSGTSKRSAKEAQAVGDTDDAGFINALGMFWRRDQVNWKSTPALYGRQQGGEPVDFCNQKGVYLLHDGSRVVYVGRVVDQPLGARLRQHTVDRLNGRWDRFSWFGILKVNAEGQLSEAPPGQFSIEMLTATMEALLIEGLEPPQNRKRGDEFTAVEFLHSHRRLRGGCSRTWWIGLATGEYAAW